MRFALARAATTTRREIVGIATGTVSAFGIAACRTSRFAPTLLTAHIMLGASRFVSVPFAAHLTFRASTAHIMIVEITFFMIT